MSYRRGSVSEEDKHALVFDVDSGLIIPEDKIEGFHEIYEEFILYKTDSADLGNIPCPPESLQMEYLSLIDTFGKDKPNYFPKPSAKKENLHHVHVFDGQTDEDIEKWVNKPQSRRSCDTLLFYSYFEFENQHYFYILQFVADPKGHEFQKNTIEMGNLTKKAQKYRTSIVSAC